MTEKEILLYGPQNEKDLKKLYPSLYEEQEFKNLTGKELLLTWYYGNPTSPVLRLMKAKKSDSVTERWHYCFIAVYGESGVPKDDLLTYQNRSYAPKINSAIQRWTTMRPDIRYRAKMMDEHMMDTLEKMVYMNEDYFKIKDKEGKVTEEIDWDAKKKYTNACKDVNEILPVLVKRIEDGYGISVTDKGQTGESAVDRRHKRNRE